MARSNSAKAPTICVIIRPAGVVVSIASVKLRNPAPASPELLHDREQVAQRARQPIQLPDNDHITGLGEVGAPQADKLCGGLNPGEIYLSFSSSQVFGCHSRANRWASAICEAVICSASLSLPDR